MLHNRIFMAFGFALVLSAAPALAAEQCNQETKYVEWYELIMAPEGSNESLLVALENYSNQIMAGVAAEYGGEFPDDKFCEAIDKSIARFTGAPCYKVCTRFWDACFTAQGSQPRVKRPSKAWQICEISRKECIVTKCTRAN